MIRLKEAREAKGWTQERLAEAMSTTQQTIQRWETGQTDIKAHQLKEMSKALGVTVTFIMGIDENYTDDIVLSKYEERLIELYRKLPPPGKHALLAGLEDYVNHQNKTQ